MKKFIITEDVEVVLNGKKYLLEAGDEISISDEDLEAFQKDAEKRWAGGPKEPEISPEAYKLMQQFRTGKPEYADQINVLHTDFGDILEAFIIEPTDSAKWEDGAYVSWWNPNSKKWYQLDIALDSYNSNIEDMIDLWGKEHALPDWTPPQDWVG